MKKLLLIVVLILLVCCQVAGARTVTVVTGQGVASAGKTIAHVANDDYAQSAEAATTGNTIVLFIYNEIGGYQHAVATVSSIADTASNTYTKITSIAETYNRDYEVWFATNITGNANNVITVTFSDAADVRRMSVMEFSGLGTATVDVYDECTGANAPSSCAVTTTSAVALLFTGLLNTQQASNGSAGSGYTITTEPGYTLVTEYQIASSTGTYNGNFTGFSNGTWYTIQVALK